MPRYAHTTGVRHTLFASLLPCHAIANVIAAPRRYYAERVCCLMLLPCLRHYVDAGYYCLRFDAVAAIALRRHYAVDIRCRHADTLPCQMLLPLLMLPAVTLLLSR